MTPPRSGTKVAVGLGAAAAAAAAGVVAERLSRGGRLQEWVQPDGYEHVPDEVVAVSADDGVQLHVEIDGPIDGEDPDRPTVVFSHGYALSCRSWVLQRRALKAAGYRVVAWDQRSHGQSGRATKESCTIDQLGADLHSVIEAVAPSGPLALIGHSMGGMTVMALGEQHPEVIRERVTSVGFVATSPGGQQMVTLGFGALGGRLISRIGPGVLGGLGRAQQRFDAIRRIGRSVEHTLIDRYSFDSPMSPEAVEFCSELIFATPLTVMADFLPALEAHDKRDALDAFDGVECLVLNGMGDLLTPPEHSQEIVERIPGAEHVLIRDAGHMVMLEHPDVVDEQLLLLIERGSRAQDVAPTTRAKPRVRRLLTDVQRMRTGAARDEKPASKPASSTARKAKAAAKTATSKAAKATKSRKDGSRR